MPKTTKVARRSRRKCIATKSRAPHTTSLRRPSSPSSDGVSTACGASNSGGAPSGGTKAMNKYDKQWWENYNKLKMFKEKSGHCNVPRRYTDDPKLGEWVGNHRRKLRPRDGKTRSPKDQERHDALESIGFEFGIMGGASTSETRAEKENRRWWENFYKLKEYDKKFGDCNVPRNYEADPHLANWVHYQRKFRPDDCERLSKEKQERIDALNELGFEFSRRERPPTWEERFKELQEHQKKHGNCDVPKRQGSLGEWVSYQRCNYNKGSMTTEQKENLESIGFLFQSNRKFEGQYDHKGWNKRLEELRQYKETKGDCDVPTSYGENPGLAGWVQTQRRQHHKLIAGKASNMTMARVSTLNELGFSWRIKTASFDKQKTKAKGGACTLKRSQTARRTTVQAKSTSGCNDQPNHYAGVQDGDGDERNPPPETIVYSNGVKPDKANGPAPACASDEPTLQASNCVVRDAAATIKIAQPARDPQGTKVVSPSSVEAIGETLAHSSSRGACLHSRCGVNRNMHDDQAGFDAVASAPDDDELPRLHCSHGRKQKRHMSKKEGANKRKRSVCDEVEIAPTVLPGVASTGVSSIRDDNCDNDTGLDGIDSSASHSRDGEFSSSSCSGGRTKMQATGKEDSGEQKQSKKAGREAAVVDATTARATVEASLERSSRGWQETEQRQATAMAEAVEAARKELKEVHRVQTRMTDERNRLQAQVNDAKKETEAARSDASKAQSDLTALKEASRKNMIAVRDQLTVQFDAEVQRVRDEMETKQTALTKKWEESKSATAARHESELQKLRQGVVAQVAAAEERVRAEVVKAHRAELDRVRDEADAAVTKVREEVECAARTNINALKDREVDLMSALKRIRKEATLAAAEVSAIASAATVAKNREESLKRQMEEALAAKRSCFDESTKCQAAQHAEALNALQKRCNDATSSTLKSKARLKSHRQQSLEEWTERGEETERTNVANQDEQISSLQQQLFASQMDLKWTQSELDDAVEMCKDTEHQWDMTSARDAAEIASLRQQLAQVVEEMRVTKHETGSLRVKNAHLKKQLEEAKIDAAEQRGKFNDLQDMFDLVTGSFFEDESKPAQGVQVEQGHVARKPPSTTPEKRKALEDLGVVWRIEKHCQTASWDERVQEPRDCKKRRGGCNVRDSPKLLLDQWEKEGIVTFKCAQARIKTWELAQGPKRDIQNICGNRRLFQAT